MENVVHEHIRFRISRELALETFVGPSGGARAAVARLHVLRQLLLQDELLPAAEAAVSAVRMLQQQMFLQGGQPSQCQEAVLTTSLRLGTRFAVFSFSPVLSRFFSAAKTRVTTPAEVDLLAVFHPQVALVRYE